ncbi:hypothetical protein [Hydrocarboniphaga effusa]|uniref:hypothetical protein n=1 Tax=Hydrocarboniphaga effusa TaxID=243629 RepID=UPI00398C01DA
MTAKSEAAATILAVASAATYPLIGDWLYIIIGALCGAFFSFSRSGETGKVAALRSIGSFLFSFALSGVVALYISRTTGDEVQIWLSPVSFVLAAFSDPIAALLKDQLQEWIPALKRKKEGA